MDETRRETWATYFGLFTSIIPAMIASGLMPAWNVLPFAAWFAIASAGGGLAGLMATPRWGRGLIAGLISGAGIFGGIWLYLTMRSSLIGHGKVWKVEVGLGAMIGWAPGLLLYCYWARPDRNRTQVTAE